MTRYSMRVAWSDPDGMFVATCPELRDLSALGTTPEQAAAELTEAIDLALETYRDEGMPAPEPAFAHEFSGQFRVRLPRSMHAWLVSEAEREGVSLNALVTTLLAAARGEASAGELAATRTPAAPHASTKTPAAPRTLTRARATLSAAHSPRGAAAPARASRVSDAKSPGRSNPRSSAKGARSRG